MIPALHNGLENMNYNFSPELPKAVAYVCTIFCASYIFVCARRFFQHRQATFIALVLLSMSFIVLIPYYGMEKPWELWPALQSALWVCCARVLIHGRAPKEAPLEHKGVVTFTDYWFARVFYVLIVSAPIFQAPNLPIPLPIPFFHRPASMHEALVASFPTNDWRAASSYIFLNLPHFLTYINVYSFQVNMFKMTMHLVGFVSIADAFRQIYAGSRRWIWLAAIESVYFVFDLCFAFYASLYPAANFNATYTESFCLDANHFWPCPSAMPTPYLWSFAILKVLFVFCLIYLLAKKEAPGFRFWHIFTPWLQKLSPEVTAVFEKSAGDQTLPSVTGEDSAASDLSDVPTDSSGEAAVLTFDLEETAGISSGIGPDISAQVEKRQMRDAQRRAEEQTDGDNHQP